MVPLPLIPISPVESEPHGQEEVVPVVEPPRDVKIEDLITGELEAQPWQIKKYDSDSMTWQGAALRRRMHTRRSYVSLGVATADLSGPHEASPRPNKHITKDPCYYYLVLTVGPDDTAIQIDAGAQA